MTDRYWAVHPLKVKIFHQILPVHTWYLGLWKLKHSHSFENGKSNQSAAHYHTLFELQIFWRSKLTRKQKAGREFHKWEERVKKLLAQNLRLHVAILTVKWRDLAANVLHCLNSLSFLTKEEGSQEQLPSKDL